MRLSPAVLYQHALDHEGWQEDPAQHAAVLALENCFQALHAHREAVPGVYLWGPVGRGKTWLMDAFYRSLQVPARRQHFHRFMQWVHRRLFQLSGQPDPLSLLARELASEIRVLCFDELFVADIGDAMILGRLFQQLFEQGLTLITTSNHRPQDLYRDGFNFARFAPAIVAMQQHMTTIEVDGGQDHRLHAQPQHQRYWVDDISSFTDAFTASTAGQAVTTRPVTLGSRSLTVVRRSPDVLWCTYAALCEAPWTSVDYIALCDRFQALFLDDVPRLGGTQRDGAIARGTEDGSRLVAAGERVLPRLARHDDSVRRLIALVDECYDQGIPLYVNAAVPLTELYTEGYLLFPFRRTLSRLQAMQQRQYGQKSASVKHPSGDSNDGGQRPP